MIMKLLSTSYSTHWSILSASYKKTAVGLIFVVKDRNDFVATYCTIGWNCCSSGDPVTLFASCFYWWKSRCSRIKVAEILEMMKFEDTPFINPSGPLQTFHTSHYIFNISSNRLWKYKLSCTRISWRPTDELISSWRHKTTKQKSLV